jgi:hypothetical protein
MITSSQCRNTLGQVLRRRLGLCLANIASLRDTHGLIPVGLHKYGECLTTHAGLLGSSHRVWGRLQDPACMHLGTLTQLEGDVILGDQNSCQFTLATACIQTCISKINEIIVIYNSDLTPN